MNEVSFTRGHGDPELPALIQPLFMRSISH